MTTIITIIRLSSYEKKGHGFRGAQWTTGSFLYGASPPPSQGPRSFQTWSIINIHGRSALGKTTVSLGSTQQLHMRVAGPPSTQSRIRSRRNWWVSLLIQSWPLLTQSCIKSKIDKNPDSDPNLFSDCDPNTDPEPTMSLWWTTQTTSESFTFTDSSSGTSLYVCKASLDFAIRVTTGQSKEGAKQDLLLLQNQLFSLQLSGRRNQPPVLATPSPGSLLIEMPTLEARLASPLSIINTLTIRSAIIIITLTSLLQTTSTKVHAFPLKGTMGRLYNCRWICSSQFSPPSLKKL